MLILTYSSTYCGFGTKLDNSQPHKLSLLSGNCTNTIPAASSTITSTTSASILQPHRIAKLFWQVVGAPVKGSHPKPPKLFWKILINEQPVPIDGDEGVGAEERYFWSPYI